MATDATAIIAIPEALLETAATRHFEGTLDLAELAAGPDTYTFAAPVSWSVEATNTGDAILIQGTAAGDATTQCARCLEDVTYGLEGDIEGYFLSLIHIFPTPWTRTPPWSSSPPWATASCAWARCRSSRCTCTPTTPIRC